MNQKKNSEKRGQKKEMSTVVFLICLAAVCLVVYGAVRLIMTRSLTGGNQGQEPAASGSETDSEADPQNASETVGQEALDTMEQYLQAGSYQELYDYYESQEQHSSADRKYWEVASVWRWMSFMNDTKDALAAAQEESGAGGYYGISYALSGASEACGIIDEALNDGVSRGNEEILTGFRDEILTFLRDDLQMTEEEIAQVTERSGSTPDWDAMEMVIRDRLGI